MSLVKNSQRYEVSSVISLSACICPLAMCYFTIIKTSYVEIAKETVVDKLGHVCFWNIKLSLYHSLSQTNFNPVELLKSG